MAQVADYDERANAPVFTEEHARYLEKVLLQLGGEDVTIFQPGSMDATVKLMGIIGRKRGRQDVIEHIRSLLKDGPSVIGKVLS